MDVLELIGNPVRLRIVHALRGRTLTTAQLRERLPDVSKAMLYRHVDLLADGGILEIAEERRVRGAVERHYRLNAERARITPETAATLTPDDHRRGFGIALAGLLAEFNAYLAHDGADPATDAVGYRQHAIWLDEAELHALITELRAAILPRLANSPTPERSRYLLSPILFPSAEPDSD